MIRVRIAPSPTGIPHIGNTRTALFNYLFARRNKGKFILRIEDTDQKRVVPGAEEAIYEILEWLGLHVDAKFKQSERLDLYKEASQILLRQKNARMEEGAVRFIVPKGRVIEWVDMVGNKNISFKSDDIEDFIVLKSDGYPTYHLANIVDDHLMEISHVIRGDEWISSTPKHILLYESLGWDQPIFAHLPVILGPDKTKLSKRHGAKSVLDYRNEGILKEALLNFMAFLGWATKGDKEILSIAEIIALFDLKDVNTNPPIFNIDKLLWFNGHYIRTMPVHKLVSSIKHQVLNMRDKDNELIKKIVPLAQTRMKTLKDFVQLAAHFFEEPKTELSQKEKMIADQLTKRFSTMEQWNNGTILVAIKNVMASENVRMPIIYKIITGQDRGLPLPESIEILGKEKTLERLKRLIS
ncbi:MAG: glutamate--tRNA ligase family protein [Patescibacteria group bacterium]